MSEKRGIPLVGRGMTGAVPGTDPVNALLAKERRQENLVFDAVAWARKRVSTPEVVEQPRPRSKPRKRRRVLPPNGRTF